MENSNFIANTVHEIRTPVQTIIGTLELLSDTKLNTEQTEYVRQIKFGADVLLTLVNDILDFSKIESGKMEICEHDYKLSDVLDYVTNMIQLKAAEKELVFLREIDEELPNCLYVDDARLRQVILN